MAELETAHVQILALALARNLQVQPLVAGPDADPGIEARFGGEVELQADTEAKIVPRAFGGVRTVGGDEESVPAVHACGDRGREPVAKIDLQRHAAAEGILHGEGATCSIARDVSERHGIADA